MSISLLRKLILLSFLLVLVAVVTTFSFVRYVKVEGPLTEKINFEVLEGESLASVSKKLKEYGVINSRLIFLAHIKIKGIEKKIRFGEYLILEKISIIELAKLFTSGKQLNHSITIPEGWTSWKIIESLNSNKLLSGVIDIIPMEGALAPDTYFITKGEDKNNLIKRMKRRQERLLSEIWIDRKSGLPLNSPRELLILASIIEKETGKKGEREVIASVLVNRIKKKMRLQVDPTVIYGITEGMRDLGRKLNSSDLKRPTDYNTYLLYGLPKGPICNPGVASIIAAANPKSSELLYFVADGEGGHLFAKDLTNHIENVKLWKQKLNK